MEISFLQGNGIEVLPQFLTSLAIGLLIGLERERNPSAKAGLRTFALVALFGTLTALLSTKLDSPWLLIAGLLAVAGMIITAYMVNPREETDSGTTTIIALLMCYGLGALIWYGPAEIAIMLAVAVTILLYFKPELHGISQKLTRQDLVAVLEFCVLTFVILPILPNQTYGPYDAFNPYQAWLMVVLVSGISLAGYTALHMVGTRYGAPLLGFFGGLVSSTATTLVYAKNSRDNQTILNLAASVIVIAGIVVLLRLFAVCGIVAYSMLPGLIPVLAGGFFLGLAVALYNWRKMNDTSDLFVPETANPAELHTAIRFGILYVVILLGSAWMKNIAGSQGLYAVALVSGLTDVDAITLSSLRLFNLGQLSEHQTVIAIALAFLSNLAFKFGMVLFIGGRNLARLVASGFIAMACGVLLGLFAL
jgi:uncharacterized membrane protein (DUF4010 family)